MEFNVTTNGINVFIEDIGVNLAHPQTMDLLQEGLGLSDIIDSTDLDTFLNTGELSATNSDGREIPTNDIFKRVEEISLIGSPSLSNTIEFSDDTYIYFVSDVSTGGWQVNRYEDSVILTKTTGTGNRPNDVPSLQSLNYI